MTSVQTSFPTKHLVTLPGLGPQHSFLGDTVQPTVLNVRTICCTPVIPQNPLLTKRRAPSPTEARVHDLPSRQVSGAQTQDDYWQAWTRGRTDHGRWGEEQNEPGICLSHSKGQTPPTQLHTRSSYLFTWCAPGERAGSLPMPATRPFMRGGEQDAEALCAVGCLQSPGIRRPAFLSRVGPLVPGRLTGAPSEPGRPGPAGPYYRGPRHAPSVDVDAAPLSSEKEQEQFPKTARLVSGDGRCRAGRAAGV